jgi:hypothetical protein
MTSGVPSKGPGGILFDQAQQPFCDHTQFHKNEIGRNVWRKTIHDNFVNSKVYAFPLRRSMRGVQQHG